MVSVTSEVLANASFQNAQAKSARADSGQSAGKDSFATLVDSNTAATNNDNRAQDRARDSAPAARRPDDSQAASDSRARDKAAASDKAASDKAARNDANDRDAAARPRDDGRTDTKVDAKADTSGKAESTKSNKSKSGKSDETKKTTSGDDAAAKDQTEAVQDGTAVVTADAVAAAVTNPATTAPAASAPAPTAADKTAAPLAFAAAAIAASASLASETAPATPAAEGGDTDTTSTADAKADGSKIKPQDVVGQTVGTATASADTTVTTGIAQAAAAVATTPAASKPAVQAKNPVVAKEGAATAGDQDGTAATEDTSATATTDAGNASASAAPQTEAAGKPKGENGKAEAAKADASGNNATLSAAPANAHSAIADAGQTPINSSGNTHHAAGAIQTQHVSASSTSAPAAQLTATAATGAPVPLSGLAMEIAATANSGKTRFEIRLDPAELGRIDVRIDIDRHGQMTSHLTVERPETLQMLRQDANQLQRALDNAGLSTGNAGLQFSLRDQSSQGQNDGGQSNPNAHRVVVSEEDSVPSVVAGRGYGRMLGSSGGVDIRI